MAQRSPESGPVIIADDLGIKFPAGRRRRMKVRELLAKGRTGAPGGQEDFWALRNVSFQVDRGEAVGIIGGNGHGKSTLLRLISAVMIPDEGSAWVRGGSTKVAPLIEVTGGFSGELTVRDNIWLAAGLKGLTKRQIAGKFDEIVEFAEIGHRLEQPFRHLSSGMKAKVGFAVVTSIDKPIVLVDEVLSVGDRAFKNKCFLRMEEMLGQGKTVLLVSHSAVQVERFCKRGIYLRDGRLIGDGPVSEILTRYGQDADRLAEDDRSALRARRRAARMLRDADEGGDDPGLGAPRRRRRPPPPPPAPAEVAAEVEADAEAAAEAERRRADLDD
ncbi:MAG TPA: ABC transporter ATP-binding protein [Sporichthyaceae bacterium]|jgi:ABC-2 type transport system ATP-binding protein